MVLCTACCQHCELREDAVIPLGISARGFMVKIYVRCIKRKKLHQQTGSVHPTVFHAGSAKVVVLGHTICNEIQQQLCLFFSQYTSLKKHSKAVPSFGKNVFIKCQKSPNRSSQYQCHPASHLHGKIC